MKKAISALLVLIMVLSLAGCGGNETPKTVNLTSGNWQNYFEPVIVYGVRNNIINKEPDYVDCIVSLVPKDNVHVISVTDGHAAFEVRFAGGVVLRLDTKTKDYTMDPMTDEEKKLYARFISSWSEKYVSENDFRDQAYYYFGKPDYYLGETPSGWCCGVQHYADERAAGDFTMDGDMLIAPIPSGVDVNVMRITGTLICDWNQ